MIQEPSIFAGDICRRNNWMHETTMRKKTMAPYVLAYLGAALIAASSATFGAALARAIWADDLKHAQRIDAIRAKSAAIQAKTEGYLRSEIKSLEEQLALRR
jgi:hypothetical protein